MSTSENLLNSAAAAAVLGIGRAAVRHRVRLGRLVPDATTTSGAPLFKPETIANQPHNLRPRRPKP